MHKDEIEKFDYFPQELIEKMMGISDNLSDGTCNSDAAIQRPVSYTHLTLPTTPYV